MRALSRFWRKEGKTDEGEKTYLFCRLRPGGRVSLPCPVCSQGPGTYGLGAESLDGRVEMEVQGEEETIKTMISRLRAGTFVAIDSMTQAEVPLQEDEREFRITG